MDEKQLSKQLEQEGYSEVRACPINTEGEISEPHTHDQHTVHIILEGEITLIDDKGEVHLKAGDRFEIPEGTTHSVKTPATGCTFLTGVKE